MFLHYYVEMDQRATQVEVGLLDSPATWMPALASNALARGEAIFAQGGAGHALAAGPARPVDAPDPEIQLGEPVRFPSKLSLPMSWDAGGRLLPRLEADLELASLGSMRAQLAVNGRYRTPMDTASRISDRLAFHRIAEAIIKDFLDQVAVAIASGPDGRAQALRRPQR